LSRTALCAAAGQGAYGPVMMDGFGVGWMGGYGSLSVAMLLVVVVGAVAFIVMQKQVVMSTWFGPALDMQTAGTALPPFLTFNGVEP